MCGPAYHPKTAVRRMVGYPVTVSSKSHPVDHPCPQSLQSPFPHHVGKSNEHVCKFKDTCFGRKVSFLIVPEMWFIFAGRKCNFHDYDFEIHGLHPYGNTPAFQLLATVFRRGACDQESGCSPWGTRKGGSSGDGQGGLVHRKALSVGRTRPEVMTLASLVFVLFSTL